jgi:hypothetical protein
MGRVGCAYLELVDDGSFSCHDRVSLFFVPALQAKRQCQTAGPGEEAKAPIWCQEVRTVSTEAAGAAIWKHERTAMKHHNTSGCVTSEHTGPGLTRLCDPCRGGFLFTSEGFLADDTPQRAFVAADTV